MSYALVSHNDDLVDVGSAEGSSNKYQKTMFWSLGPANILVPLFIAFGRALFGGPIGSAPPSFLFTVIPLTVAFHLLLSWLAIKKNRKRFFNDAAEYCLSQQASHLLVLYYASHVVFQLFFSEFNSEHGHQGSVAETKFGASEDVCDDVMALIGNALICLAAFLLIHIHCFEKIEVVRKGPAIIDMV